MISNQIYDSYGTNNIYVPEQHMMMNRVRKKKESLIEISENSCSWRFIISRFSEKYINSLLFANSFGMCDTETVGITLTSI